jgi:tetratricopeptide (TPR) repeat protein
MRPRHWIAALLLAVTGCKSAEDTGELGESAGRSSTESAARPRILLLGLDGADFDTVDRLIAEGRLPNLARLKAEGSCGRARSMEPMLSPILWTTIATGRLPEDHGVGWFMVENDATGQRVPVTSSVRRCKAIWNVLDERELSSGIIGWWATYPAEPVDGFIVTDSFAFHNFGVTGDRAASDLGKVHPLSLLDAVDELRVTPETLSVETVRRILPMSDDEIAALQGRPLDFADPRSHLLHILATAETYTNLGLSLLEERPTDLFAVYYEGIDSVSHLFQRFAAPRMESIGEEEFARYKDVVDNFYEYQDEILGRYLQRIPEETTVVLVSDHGFAVGDERPREGDKVVVAEAHLWHQPDGILIARGPNIRPGKPVYGSNLLDVAPTLLYALGLPVARDMPGKVVVDLFRGSWLESNVVQRIASYEGNAAPRERVETRANPGTPEPTEPTEVDAEVAGMVEERLRALGYIGDSEDESSPEIHVNLGERCFAKGDLAQALRMRPEDPGARLWLGRVLVAQRRFDDAEQLLEETARIVPGAAEVTVMQATVATETGRLEEAAALLEGARSTHPDHIGVLLALCDVQSRRGLSEQALAAADAALQIAPESLVARYNRAVVLHTSGHAEEAIAEYQRILAIDAANVRTLTNLGQILLATEDRREEGIRCFRTAQELAPDSFETNFNLATVLVQDSALDEAEPLLRTATRARPDDFQARRLLAIVYAFTNRVPKAFDEWRRLSVLHPAQIEPWYRLARILWMSGQPLESSAALHRAAALNHDEAAQLVADDPVFEGKPLDELLAMTADPTEEPPTELEGSPTGDGGRDAASDGVPGAAERSSDG